MKKALGIVSALILSSSMAMAADNSMSGDTPTPGKEAGAPTSDRTPGKETKTPLSQTTKVDGKTSDRTPSNSGSSDGATDQN